MHIVLDSPSCIICNSFIVNIFFRINYWSVVLFSDFSTYVYVVIFDEYL